jgi:hypothetical protein
MNEAKSEYKIRKADEERGEQETARKVNVNIEIKFIFSSFSPTQKLRHWNNFHS